MTSLGSRSGVPWTARSPGRGRDDRPGQDRLPDAGDIFDQDVPTRQQGDQHEADALFLDDDRLPDRITDRAPEALTREWAPGDVSLDGLTGSGSSTIGCASLRPRDPRVYCRVRLRSGLTTRREGFGSPVVRVTARRVVAGAPSTESLYAPASIPFSVSAPASRRARSFGPNRSADLHRTVTVWAASFLMVISMSACA